MPFALRGTLLPAAVAKSFAKTPIRIQKCIVALCELGLFCPFKTKLFADYPEAGLKAIESIAWDPEVRVRVKASCWYVSGGRTIIPVLQPRKAALDLERLAIYVALVRQAYCQGDWIEAGINLIDLSGEDDAVVAKSIDLGILPMVSEKLIGQYVQTFVQAKKMADAKRKEKVKPVISLPMAELLGLDK